MYNKDFKKKNIFKIPYTHRFSLHAASMCYSVPLSLSADANMRHAALRIPLEGIKHRDAVKFVRQLIRQEKCCRTLKFDAACCEFWQIS
jgi:hypothetical protein